MADFHKAFEAIDEDNSGEITVEELEHYMRKNNYKKSFVTKWLTLFDGDNCGKISYRHYCETLGLIPKDRGETTNKREASVNKDKREASVNKDKREASVNKDKREASVNKDKREASVNKDKSGASVTEEKEQEEEFIEMSVSKKDSAAMTNSKGKGGRKKKVTKMAVDAPVDNNTAEVKSEGRRPKSYPVQVKEKSPHNRKSLFSNHVRRLRASIQPGIVVILLAGRYRGKRVVFLDQLSSGLLLVTGPFKVNGCPLRRVHQKMVIATKTKIDISGVKIPENINDLYFARDTSDKKKDKNADVSTIFAKTKKTYALKDERKKDQKEIDVQVMKVIKSREDKVVLLKYLKSVFSLSSHDCPHKMVF